MPFNPSLPRDGSLMEAEEMRAQFTALNADTQTRATSAEVNLAIATAVAGTSNNCNGVQPLYQSANPDYSQAQMQDVLSKLEELITALHR